MDTVLDFSAGAAGGGIQIFTYSSASDLRKDELLAYSIIIKYSKGDRILSRLGYEPFPFHDKLFQEVNVEI